MLINKTYFIDSCDDFELGIKRTSKLEYRMTFDDEKEMKAIVFIVGGFGVNSNISFLDFDRKFICEKFDVVVVDVFYHCFCARKSINEEYNPKLIPNYDDIENLKKILRFLGVNAFVNEENFKDFLPFIEQKMQEMKDNNLLDKNQKAIISCDFVPPNDEYQNYGIMAAIDHINALKDIMKNYPQFKSLPKIYGGGSYGGYISCLIAKIAPWYVDGAIDNSGGALPPFEGLIGKEMQKYDYTFNDPNTIIKCNVKTLWTRKDPNSPYYFGDENYLIRALLNQTHLILQAQKNKDIIYVSYHSSKDEATPAEYKIQMCEILKALKYDITFHLIDEKDIDGKFIKNLEHGCGIPDKALFNKELPIMLEKTKK